MAVMNRRTLPFEEDEARGTQDGEAALLVDVDGFEGPLDLLLELARRQKVDLARISILALAEQYLAFVEQARKVRLELAADYLVMAAWLAFLKSRLLLPEPPRADEPSAADMATALALRLQRLEMIRAAARKLGQRSQLGQDVFARGAPEAVVTSQPEGWEATIHDLLSAYARQRQARAARRVTVHKRAVWALAEAREALSRLLGVSGDWTSLDEHLMEYLVEPAMRATVRASSLAAALEMVREGHMEIRQGEAFTPIYVRRHAVASAIPANVR
jgi:segregation and condensation protein A